MIRTILLSMATAVLTGTLTNAAAPPEPGVKDGFRVYTISPRCRSRSLVGVYPTAAKAFEVAAGARAKTAPDRVEVTTGSEGKTTPTGRPALYEVYTRGCIRSQWELQPALYTDEKKAVEAGEKTNLNVEIVRDYAPKEVYHVYGLPCRTIVGTKSRLQGTYRSAGVAIEAANRLREGGRLRCEVTTGTKGEELLDGVPTRFVVYVQGCKSGWTPETTGDLRKTLDAYKARLGEKVQAEIVSHYGPEGAAAGAPKVSGVFDGEKTKLPPKSAFGGVESAAALLKSCTSNGDGTAADIAAALKGDHVRLAFAEPREFEVDGKKVLVSGIVVTLPVYTSVLWVRSGDKVFRETKFDPKKWAAFEAWLDAARAAG